MVRLINNWKKDNFELQLFNMEKFDHHGKRQLKYKFYWDNQLLFKGNEYCPSPLYNEGSDEEIFSLLGFLSIRPGDTYPDYFKNYTPKQLIFTNSSDCEELSLLVSTFEENKND